MRHVGMIAGILGLGWHGVLTHAYQCETQYFGIKNRSDVQSIDMVHKLKAAGEPVIHITQHSPMKWEPDENPSQDKLDEFGSIIRFYTDITRRTADGVDLCNQRYFAEPTSIDDMDRPRVTQPKVSSAPEGPSLLPIVTGSPDSPSPPSPESTLSTEEVFALRQKYFAPRFNKRRSGKSRVTLVDVIQQEQKALLYPRYLAASGLRQELTQRYESFLSLFIFPEAWDAPWSEAMETRLTELSEDPDNLASLEALLLTALTRDQRFPEEDRLFLIEYVRNQDKASLPFEALLTSFGALETRTFEQTQMRLKFSQMLGSLFARDQQREQPHFILDQIQQWQRKLGAHP